MEMFQLTPLLTSHLTNNINHQANYFSPQLLSHPIFSTEALTYEQRKATELGLIQISDPQDLWA